MKIEAGRYYVAANGEKFGPMGQNLAGMWIQNDDLSDMLWYSDGRLGWGDPRYNLVSEWDDLTESEKRTDKVKMNDGATELMAGYTNRMFTNDCVIWVWTDMVKVLRLSEIYMIVNK